MAWAKLKEQRIALPLAAIALCATIVGVIAFNYAHAVPDGTAAKVNDSYIPESVIAGAIAEYRIGNNLQDDEMFARALAAQNVTAAGFRLEAIDAKAVDVLVAQRADELGITASDPAIAEGVDRQIDLIRSSFAFDDEDIWQQTLDQYGLTEEALRLRYAQNLIKRAVLEQDVPRRAVEDSRAGEGKGADGLEEHEDAGQPDAGQDSEGQGAEGDPSSGETGEGGGDSDGVQADGAAGANGVESEVSDAEAQEEALWQQDCANYLARMLAKARITYYPMPDGAPYDVDVTGSVE